MINSIASLVKRTLIPLMLSAASVANAETIKVNPAAQYANDSVGSPQVRNECGFDREIIDSLVHYSRGQVEITSADLSAVHGKTLKVVITSVHGAGGGGYSGPKWGNLLVTLSDNGQVIDEYKVNVHTMSGRWTACDTLFRIAKKLGAKAAKQLLMSHMQGRAAPKDNDRVDDGADDTDHDGDEEKK